MVTRRWSIGLRSALCFVLLAAFSLTAQAEKPSTPHHAAAAIELAAPSAKPTLSCYARCKAWMKAKFVAEKDLEIYGMVLDQGWRKKAVEKDVVVLIHGFNSSSQRNEALMQSVRAAGYPCATFNYPNDDELEKAAARLSQELREFAADHPARRVTLLTHSAGGLVARACVEDPTLDPGNVHKMILIAPPNHGSVLARLAVGMDLCEHGPNFGRGGFRASIADGMCEMREDLQPNSKFLTRLNSHGINEHVSYTLLLGTGARISQRKMDVSRYLMRKSTNKLPESVKARVARLDEKLAELDEVITGRGDGAVAVRRARLDGVKDTVLLEFEHLTVTSAPDTPVLREVHDVVLDRLAR